MSKYVDDNGNLRPEYMEKIQSRLNEVDRKYEEERVLLSAGMPAKKRAYEIARLNHENACKAVEAAYIAWMSGDNGFGMAIARNKAKKRIYDDAVKTFSDLQDIEDEKDGKAQRRTELKTACMKLGIKPPSDISGRKFIESRKSILEEIAADEAESREALG